LIAGDAQRREGATVIDTFGYAVHEPRGKLSPFRFQRHSPREHEILMEVLYCGICHSDLVVANDAFGRTPFPLVPGHEIVGRVIDIGGRVTRFAVGDLAGIGCIVDSCRACGSCRSGEEHYCAERFVSSFGGRDRAGESTYGGYSKHYVVDENYALRIPAALDPAAAAPLLCGGITTYTPLRRYGVGNGQKVGVLGLGGLGHLAIKISAALGATPVILTSSAGKVADAEKLGAASVILTSDKAQMKRAAGSLDFILDTVSAPHDPNPFLALLRRAGTMCLVGLPEKPLSVNPGSLVFGDKALAGSLIGGIAGTQEMLDFCATRGIAAQVEMIAMDYVNEAWDRIERGDVKYRFVIDMATLRA
jgi:uncharacterized zinc-type alcohol dehydrogenase-like protein